MLDDPDLMTVQDLLHLLSKRSGWRGRAAKEIEQALQDGVLSAFGGIRWAGDWSEAQASDDQSDYSISSEFWKTNFDGAPPAINWGDGWAHKTYSRPIKEGARPPSMTVTRIKVRRTQALELWPELSKASENVRLSEGKPTRKGGRPITHDWPKAAGYMAGYVHMNGYPEQQAVLVDALLKWFTEVHGKEPDRREVERFVSGMYEARDT
jgi:hypothetical protein